MRRESHATIPTRATIAASIEATRVATEATTIATEAHAATHAAVEAFIIQIVSISATVTKFAESLCCECIAR